MKPGTKPKPTHLKLVTGNPGKRALNRKEAKAKAAIAAPIKPFVVRTGDQRQPAEGPDPLENFGSLERVAAHHLPFVGV